MRTVCVGTGCYCTPIACMDMAADLYVAVDDTIRNWVEASIARDTGLPLVGVNHGTSEEAGFAQVAHMLRRLLPLIDLFHYKQGCT